MVTTLWKLPKYKDYTKEDEGVETICVLTEEKKWGEVNIDEKMTDGLRKSDKLKWC